jgi:hypothetical protein
MTDRGPEPSRLMRWRLSSLLEEHSFYTCARPGRSLGRHAKVPDSVVVEWARGLPDGEVVVISLLGKKPNGKDEHSFYSFFERRQSLQDWLADQEIGREIRVVEHPTTDSEPVPDTTLALVRENIRRFLHEKRTVVVMDSGGVQRTGAVCRYLGAVLITDLRAESCEWRHARS